MLKELFQQRIKALLADSGLSAAEVAKKAGISSASLNYYINGKRCPDAQALFKLCTAYNISSDWLLGLSDYKTTDPDLHTACLTLNISQLTGYRIMRCEDIETLFLVEDEVWESICAFLSKYNKLDLTHRSETEERSLEDGSVLLPRTKAAYYYAQMVGNKIAEGLVRKYDENTIMDQKLQADEQSIIDGKIKDDFPIW